MDAGTVTNPVLGNLGKLSGQAFFAGFFPAAVSLAFIIGTLLFVGYFIWGAIDWIASGGDKQKLESARGRITNAIIGLILLFAAFAIIRVVETFFNIHIISGIDLTQLQLK